jgi:hypothetical protein
MQEDDGDYYYEKYSELDIGRNNNNNNNKDPSWKKYII